MERNTRKPGRASGGRTTITKTIQVRTSWHWGTELERRLSRLPYPELSEAFKAVAEVLEDGGIGGLVAQCVRDAKTFTKCKELLSQETFFEHAASTLEKSLSGRTHPRWELPLLSLQSVFLTFGNLWRISHRLSQKNKQLPQPELVKEITHVCLLAERARHALYSENRRDQWHKLISKIARRMRRSKSESVQNIKRALVKENVDAMLRQYETQRPKFTNADDAATACAESTLHSFDPMLFHATFRWLEAKASTQDL